MTPRTPDSFPGVREDEGLILLDEGYGVPQSKGGFRYSDGYLYAKDEYGVFNIRTYVHPHVATHLGGGTDSFYEITNRDPTINDDSYNVGHRWINLADSYEFVLADNTPSNALWLQSIGNSDFDKLVRISSNDISSNYLGSKIVDGYNIQTTELNDGGVETLEIKLVDHGIIRDLIHFINEGPANGFVSGATKEISPVGNPFPTQVIWKDAGGNKLVEKNITRDSKKNPTTIEWIMYDTDGVGILHTIIDTITYSGIFEISRTRSIT